MRMPTIMVNLETDTVLLPPPEFSPSAALQLALKSRSSSRSFSSAPLTLETLSVLLWAGFGINRAASSGRTAPSAHNWQEIDVFAVMNEGAYRYDPKGHQLLLVKAKDLRAATGTQDFVATAPLNLVYVADFARMGNALEEEKSFLAGADTGCIAENVYLICACLNLATVVRGLIDRKHLATELGLSATERVVLAQSVGTRPSGEIREL
jgi:SagB-type dehydrogenase family enzyme